MSEETAIAVKAPTIDRDTHGLVLRTLDDQWLLAKSVIKSGMAPPGYTTSEQVFIAIQHGAELGLAPMQSLHSIAVINKRATVYGDAIPGLLLASGLLEDIQEYFETANGQDIAVCRLKRKGIATSIEATFSEDDAKKAGLWGKAGPWQNYPRRMLKMRARSWAARDGFADVLRGLAVREEVLDYEPRQARQEPRRIEITADGTIAEPEPAKDVVAALDELSEASGGRFDEPQDGELF